MKPIEPYPGETDDPECAILFANYKMDYLAIRAWSQVLDELLEREKIARAAIFGFRRRTKSRRKHAAAVWFDAPEDSSSANARRGTGSGVPTPPTPGTSDNEPPSLQVVGKSSRR